MGVEVEDEGNIGMIEFGESESFLAKILSRGGIGERMWREKLECNVAVEPFIVSAINDSHSARTNLFQYAIVRDGLAEHDAEAPFSLKRNAG